MSECFIATEGELKPHWNTLESELKQIFRTAEAKGKILSSPVGSQIIAVFMGTDARRAGRLRGDPIPVVLLSSVGSGWDAWIGLRESWRHTSGNKYRFSSADITVFFRSQVASSTNKYFGPNGWVLKRKVMNSHSSLMMRGTRTGRSI